MIKTVGNRNRSDSFRSVLVEIDTAKVTRVNITKPAETTEMSKNDSGQWQVALANGGVAPVDPSKIEGTFATLLSIEPSRLATRKVEKWSEYQVDSTGTNVKVYEGDDLTLDLIIGRFGTKSQREFFTYVRIAGEDEVYTADNFMSFSLQTDANGYRNQQLARINSLDSITQINFNYNDGDFTLTKATNRWLIDGAEADSTSVAGLLQNLSFVSSAKFLDGYDPANLPQKSVNLSIAGRENVSISAYADEIHEWVLSSASNPEYFADTALYSKIFKMKSDLVSNN